MQILGPLNSKYWWNNKLEETTEWLVIIKSKHSLYAELEKTIKKFHPYQTPEIIATPLLTGSADYLSWLEKELSSAQEKAS